jgi:hypothetical protein
LTAYSLSPAKYGIVIPDSHHSPPIMREVGLKPTRHAFNESSVKPRLYSHSNALRAYFGTRYPIAPQIMVIDLNSFATLGSYVLDNNCTNLVSAVLDSVSGAALFGTDTGYVARITMGGHWVYLPSVRR